MLPNLILLNKICLFVCFVCLLFSIFKFQAMGEIGSAFHQNNITIKVSMSFRASDNIAEKLQELKVLFEPCCEKTGLQGFRPDPTQTGLCNHRRWLEALNFVFRKQRNCTSYVEKTKALISFPVTGKLICVFVFAYVKSLFSHDEAHLIVSFYTQMVTCCPTST